MIEPNITLQLPSGESLTAEEILTGLLLLARHEAPFPVITAADAHLALLMLIPAILEHNNDHEVI